MRQADYIELMKFHILMCEDDISDFKYAAVNANGNMWLYRKKPHKNHHEQIWSNDRYYTNKFVATLEPHIDWDCTVVEI